MACIQKVVRRKGNVFRVYIKKVGFKRVSKTFDNKSLADQFEKSWVEQGLTRIWYTNNTITVITNPGKEDGFNDFLEASIPKE